MVFQRCLVERPGPARCSAKRWPEAWPPSPLASLGLSQLIPQRPGWSPALVGPDAGQEVDCVTLSQSLGLVPRARGTLRPPGQSRTLDRREPCLRLGSLDQCSSEAPLPWWGRDVTVLPVHTASSLPVTIGVPSMTIQKKSGSLEGSGRRLVSLGGDVKDESDCAPTLAGGQGVESP